MSRLVILATLCVSPAWLQNSVAQGPPEIVWTAPGYQSGNAISSLAESPDGSFIASLQSAVSANGFNAGLITWSLPFGDFLRNIPLSGNAVAISPDSKLIAIGADPSSASIFSAADGAAVQTLYAGGPRVVGVAFSNDGRYFAAAGTNKVTAWNVSTWAMAKSWNTPTNVTSIVFLKDSTLIAAVRDGMLRRLNVESGASDVVATNQNRVQGLTLSPDGALLSSANFSDFKIYRTLDFSLARSAAGDYRSSAFSPDGNTIALGLSYGIEIRQVSNGTVIKAFSTGLPQLTAIRYSRDGKQLFATAANRLYVWDTGTWTSKEMTENSDTVQSVHFSRDGKTLALGCWDGNVRLRNVTDKALVASIPDGIGFRLDSVRFSPTEDLLAIARGDGVIYLRNSTNGALIRKLTGHTSVVASLSFTTNGQTLASGSWDGTVRIWDVPSGSSQTPIVAHSDRVNDVSISADGQLVASSSQDNSLSVFTVFNGAPMFAWTNSIQSPPLGVCISPHKKFLAACDSGAGLHIWNLDTRLPVTTILDAGFVCAYSANGEYLMVVGPKIKIFNAANNKLVRAYDPPIESWATSVAISPGNDSFAFGTLNAFGFLATMPALPTPNLVISIGSNVCPTLSSADAGILVEHTGDLSGPWTEISLSGASPWPFCDAQQQDYFRARWSAP